MVLRTNSPGQGKGKGKNSSLPAKGLIKEEAKD
jgi:hypothetical protein